MKASVFLIDRFDYERACAQLAQEGVAFVKLGANSTHVAVAVAEDAMDQAGLKSESDDDYGKFVPAAPPIHSAGFNPIEQIEKAKVEEIETAPKTNGKEKGLKKLS